MKILNSRIIVIIAVLVHIIIGSELSYGQDLRKTDKKYDVHIPEESYIGVEISDNGLPMTGIFNENILSLEPKSIFGWFLSLVMVFDKKSNWDLPNNEDVIRMQDFCEVLDKNLKKSPRHPNAVFLGRITGGGQTQIMWYVNNPELANEYLQKLIASNKYPFDFNFQMFQDKEWEEAHYWLESIKQEESVESYFKLPE